MHDVKNQLEKQDRTKGIQAKTQTVQGSYWKNQKKIHKQILGRVAKEQLNAVKDPLTNEVHTEPANTTNKGGGGLLGG